MVMLADHCNLLKAKAFSVGFHAMAIAFLRENLVRFLIWERLIGNLLYKKVNLVEKFTCLGLER